MSVKLAALAGATLAFCALIDSPPAAAQAMTCVDLYSRVMAFYQTAPLSPAYNQMAAAYVASCLPRTSAAPVYPQTYVQAPYYPTYYPPSSYGYAEPAYPDYGGYGYGLPIGLGLGFGFAHGFHHDRDHDRDFHHDRDHDRDFHRGNVPGGSVPGPGGSVPGDKAHDGSQH